jgi:hypothetical protein
MQNSLDLAPPQPDSRGFLHTVFEKVLLNIIRADLAKSVTATLKSDGILNNVIEHGTL